MIRLREAQLYRLELRARMPFRYGIATMTAVTHVVLRCTFEIDGQRVAGFAADNLAPKWFTKDPTQSLADEQAVVVATIRAAAANARAVTAPTAFQFWRELYAAQSTWAAPTATPPLLAQFGVSLVERALIDAMCRADRVSVAAAVKDNRLGIDLAVFDAALAGTRLRDWLPSEPLAVVNVRHTIGLADPLEPADITPTERVDDGLPQALTDVIPFYGLRQFKIKINGDVARDRERLERMAAIFARQCGTDYQASVDGNESFQTAEAFAPYAQTLLATPALREFWRHVTCVEQPWHRAVALSPAVGGLARGQPGCPPLIIDESDAALESLPAALALGYAGTTHKNCKGVFKSLGHACLLAQRRARGAAGILSGEDLTNLGPVALPQDLAVQALLGITSVERNGQHYFNGLAGFPEPLQSHALTLFPDLFVRTKGGPPRVDIREGRLSTSAASASAFGASVMPDLVGFDVEPVA